MTSLEQLDANISEGSDAITVSSSPVHSRPPSALTELHTVTGEVASDTSSVSSPVHSSASTYQVELHTVEVSSSSKNVSSSSVDIGGTDQLHTVPSDTEVNFRVRTNSGQQVGKKESRVVEVIGLVVIVLVLLAVYTIPTVFYVRPPLQLEQVSALPGHTINL